MTIIGAIIGIVAAVIAAAAAGYAAYVQAEAAETNKKAVLAEAAFKARSEENQATKVRNKGVEAEQRRRRENALFLSTQIASIAARGVSIDSGSALSLQQDTVTLGEADELDVREYFLDEARNLDVKAQLTRAHGQDLANFYSKQKSAALIGGALNIGASLAGGSAGFSGASGSGGTLTGQLTSSGNTGASSNVQGVFNSNVFSNTNSGRAASLGFSNSAQSRVNSSFL